MFQGGEMGPFVAYDADDGSPRWEFQTYGAISAPPISYAVDGTQYVAILASATNMHENFGSLLVFALDGSAEWPAPPERPREIPEPPPLAASAEEIERGSALYHEACMWCHGDSTELPLMADLKMMSAETHAQFPAVVLGGMLREEGMMGYADVLTPEDAELIRQYVISRALAGREAQGQATGSGSPAG